VGLGGIDHARYGALWWAHGRPWREVSGRRWRPRADPRRDPWLTLRSARPSSDAAVALRGPFGLSLSRSPMSSGVRMAARTDPNAAVDSCAHRRRAQNPCAYGARSPAVSEREQQPPPDTILHGPRPIREQLRDLVGSRHGRSEARSRSRATPRTTAGCSRPRSGACASLRASGADPPRRSLRTTTRSAGRDACFLAMEQSWCAAWCARSLLSRTTSRSPHGDACSSTKPAL
jgi:hypothetical protein